jgi:hypothetical protein
VYNDGIVSQEFAGRARKTAQANDLASLTSIRCSDPCATVALKSFPPEISAFSGDEPDWDLDRVSAGWLPPRPRKVSAFQSTRTKDKAVGRPAP